MSIYFNIFIQEKQSFSCIKFVNWESSNSIREANLELERPINIFIVFDALNHLHMDYYLIH